MLLCCLHKSKANVACFAELKVVSDHRHVLPLLAATGNSVYCQHQQAAIAHARQGQEVHQTAYIWMKAVPGTPQLQTLSFMRQHVLYQASRGTAWQAEICVPLCRLFGMPIALALTAGFIQSAISPTVLVTGMLELQRRGYGQDKGQSRAYVVSACMYPFFTARSLCFTHT